MNLMSQVILLCCNTVIVIWAVWPIQSEQKVSRQRTILAYVCFVLLRLPLYIYFEIIPFYQYTWLICIARLLPCLVLLRLLKYLDWKRCLYFSCIIWVSFTLYSSLRYLPWLDGLTLGGYLSAASGMKNQILAGVLWHGIDFLIVTWMTRSIPLNKIRAIGSERACMMVFVIFCELYIIQTLTSLEKVDWATDMPELKVYVILLQLFIAIGIVFFERYLISNAERENARVAELESRYRYEGLLSRQSAENDVRRVHHDMKNHLLAIRHLRSNPEEQEQYISRLIHQESAAMERLIQTGNDLLDGLLAEKLSQAEQNGVKLNVLLAFGSCDLIADIDICCIFGNILDNAIEAARQCVDSKDREVILRSSKAADQFLITCSNHYTGTLHFSSGLPITTKADGLRHGIGLSSVRNSVEKYGGVLTLDTSTPHQLILTILLPLDTNNFPPNSN